MIYQGLINDQATQTASVQRNPSGMLEVAAARGRQYPLPQRSGQRDLKAAAPWARRCPLTSASEQGRQDEGFNRKR